MRAIQALRAAERCGRGLRAPEWTALAVGVALCVAGLQAWFAPGFMSFDSLLFYEEAVGEVTRSTWPPMYAYLIRAVRALGGDYGALLPIQGAMVAGFGGFLVLRLASGPPVRRILGLALFLAAFVIVPPLLGTVIVLWNVVPVAGFLLAGAAFQLLAAQNGRLAWAMAAVAAFAVCFALRYNAIFLIAPFLLLLLVFPIGSRTDLKSRLAVGVAGLLAFLVAFGSFSHRLPDLKRLPANAGVPTIQAFDLIGVSAQCGENFLSAEMVAKGPVPVADIRGHYDPRHLNLSLAAKPGLAPISKPLDARQVDAAWRRAVTARPACYLKHRWAVFVQQMGVAPDGLFYATHGGIDPNRFGFALERPERAIPAAVALSGAANHPLRRPAWLYLGAVAVLLAAAARRDARTVPLALLVLSALTYAASHLFVAAAADARYIFPSSVLCVVVMAAAAGGRERRRAGHAPAPGLGRDIDAVEACSNGDVVSTEENQEELNFNKLDPVYRGFINEYLAKYDLDPAVFCANIPVADEMFFKALLPNYEYDRNIGAFKFTEATLRHFDAFNQIVQGVFGGFDRLTSVLDFASGYGRLTRVLIQKLRRDQIWVSDIYPEAMKWQASTFGVHVFDSTTDPRRLDHRGVHDIVFVGSMFSHLPAPLFHDWLARLYGFVGPRGVLAFSVHDETLLPEGESMDATGLRYFRTSESDTLSVDTYGMSYVTERFVADAIARLTPGGGAWRRYPKGLYENQDLYVVAAPDVSLDGLKLASTPMGGFETASLLTNGEVEFAGWAIERTPGHRIERVRVHVAGEPVAEIRPSSERPDVLRHFPHAANTPVGWRFRLSGVQAAPGAGIRLELESSTGLHGRCFAQMPAAAVMTYSGWSRRALRG